MRTEKLHQILGHYGPEAQKKKSIEELSELITLLAREQTGRVSEGELIEEIADSYNMLDQLVIIYGIKEEVKAIRKAKIERTLDHINSNTGNPCPHDDIGHGYCRDCGAVMMIDPYHIPQGSKQGNPCLHYTLDGKVCDDCSHETKTLYPWDDAPEWAMWCATDADGDFCWYENEPRRGYDEWLKTCGEHKLIKRNVPACPQWTETLEARPTKTKTRYPWNEAPEWAMWVTTDANGDLNWFWHKPYHDHEKWLRLIGDYEFFTNEGPCENWEQTLEARPK